MDRTTVLRSLTHPYPLHGVAYRPDRRADASIVPVELNPRDPRHWPFFGSVVDYVEVAGGVAARARATRRSVPANIALPFRFSSRRIGEVPRAGPYAAFLGSRVRSGLDRLRRHGRPRGWPRRSRDKTVRRQRSVHRPRRDDSYFFVPSATQLAAGRDARSARPAASRWWRSSTTPGADLAASAAGRQFDRYQQMTYDAARIGRAAHGARRAQGAAAMRELYGQTLFGQSCLAARRLVEAGSRVVSVFWDEYGLAGSGWDTHWNHYPRMKQGAVPRLRPGLVRSDHRSRPARPAGRYAGRLHQRTWPHAARSPRRKAAAAITGRGSTRR